MKKSHITLLTLLSAFTLPILAADPPIVKKYTGEIDLQGGVGSATPWSASFKGNSSMHSKLRITPSIGLRGVGRHSSEQEEDLHYTYTGLQKGPITLSTNKDWTYDSHRESHSTGYVFDYGLALDYTQKLHSISASLKGDVEQLTLKGHQYEQLFQPSLASQSAYPYAIVSSVFDGTSGDKNLELSAKYGYTIARSKLLNRFAVDYTYSREADNLERQLYVKEQREFSEFNELDLNTEGLSQKHRVQAQLTSTPLKPLMLGLNAYFENRLLQSDDDQWFGDTHFPPRTMEHFEHRYHTVGATLTARLKVKQLEINGVLDYGYTAMEHDYIPQGKEKADEKHLNDFLPTLSAVWNVNSNNTLSARYVRRLVRPSLELLNPFNVRTAYTRDYGNPDLTGMHINNIAFNYILHTGSINFNAGLQHIRANDGFNAIWMERDGMRISTWGNEGVRRAWSLTPDLTWKAPCSITVQALANVIWDKREAYALQMAKEHWGVTTRLNLAKQFDGGTSVALSGVYSEGNTIDLYSHEGRSYGAGAKLQHNFGKFCSAILDYHYNHYSKTILTQGAYVGHNYTRPHHNNQGTLTLQFHF